MKGTEEFWALVEKTSECWIWTGSCHRLGYGRPSFRGRSLYAHRISWELLRGPIPEGLSLDHLCRNPACVNPDHLEPVTHRENVLRGVGPTAENATKEVCPKGHPYTGTNLIERPTGQRGCRACHVDKGQRARRDHGMHREGAYSCDVCGWRFDNPRGVRTHKARRHREPLDGTP